MKTLNKVFLMGYVASEPQEKEFDNNTRCVMFSLKTRDFHGPQDDRKVDKNFHNCIMWNGIGDRATELIHKDNLIHVVGRLKNRRMEGKDGEKPYFKTEIVVEEWTLIPSNTDSNFSEE